MPRDYTPRERDDALALTGEHGAAEASRMTLIPAATLRSWTARATHRASAVAPGVAENAPTGATPGATYAQRRAELPARLAEALGDAVDRARDALRAGRARDARDFAVTAGILIDKLRLEEGRATARTEHATADLDAEVEQLLREVREQSTEGPPGT